MRFIYRPGVNTAIRRVLYPFRRWLPPAARLPVNGVVTVELPEGKAVRLSANPTSHLAKVLYWEGSGGYEPDLMRTFLPLAHRATLFLDVGAALGYYALVAAVTNRRMRVVAFEPTPGTYQYLLRNVELNNASNITAEQLAVSDAPGRLEFYITRNPKFPDMEQLAGTSGFDVQGATRAGIAPDRVEVTAVTLDGYVGDHLRGRRVDLLKLDTEATEDRVLAGAERVLAEHRPVVLCEVLPGRIEEALETAFAAHGYAFARATPAGLRLADHLRHGPEVPNDHVMVPRERLDEVRGIVQWSD